MRIDKKFLRSDFHESTQIDLNKLNNISKIQNGMFSEKNYGRSKNS